jgi:hypothetical protein
MPSHDVTQVSIVGDCWLPPDGRPVDLAAALGGQAPSLVVLNLECAVPSGPPRDERRALLPLDRSRLSELRSAGETVCTLANNHVMDFGPEGLLATTDAARDAGLRVLGAGETLEAARSPLTLDLGSRRIGMLAYGDTRPGVGCIAAKSGSPGVAPLVPEMIREDLRALAPRVDDVWVFLHWGNEFLRYPEPEQIEIAERLVESGATLVVGAHPHVLRGRGTIGSAPVYYSLGNFLFPPIPLTDGCLLRWDGESRDSVVLSGRTEGRTWTWSTTPVRLAADGRPRPEREGEGERIHRKLERLSSGLDAGYVRRYPAIRRRESMFYALRRLGTMSWNERLRLPSRLWKTLRPRRLSEAP